jgi:hypothetical protein
LTDDFKRPPLGVNFQRLRPYLEDALRKQKDKRTALAIARKLDRDQSPSSMLLWATTSTRST